jgi:hypothetical protein
VILALYRVLRASAGVPPLPHHVLRIVLAGADPEVSGIAAVPHIATVTHAQTFGRGYAVLERVGHAMRHSRFAVDVD